MGILRTGDRDIVSLPAVQEVWRGASDAVQQSLVKNARAITPAGSRVKSRLRQGELLPLLTLLQAGEETNGYGYTSAKDLLCLPLKVPLLSPPPAPVRPT